MLRKLFCWLYEQWLSKAVDSKSDPLVRFTDYCFGGKCSYCTNYRVMSRGIGAVLGLNAAALDALFLTASGL